MMNRLKNSFAVLGLLCAATSSSAQVSPYSIVLRTSLAPHPHIDPICPPIVTLGQARDGSIALIVRVFSKLTGMQEGSALVVPFKTGVVPADVLLSTVFSPGSVLVLDTTRRVHVIPLSFRADETPFVLAGATLLGPIGPETAGAATVLGETPNAARPDDPYLALGTKNGEVIIATQTIDPICVPVASTPILDLGGLRQVGSFVFGAVSGGRLYWIDPNINPGVPGLQSGVKGSFRDTRSVPLIDFAAEILVRTSDPWIDPGTNPIVTANGTKEIATLVIPANLTFGSTLPVLGVNTVSTPIKQVIFSSLTALPVDGSGIIYNKNFNFQDGLVGRLWTIAGATMELESELLPGSSRSRWITARIEAENQRATEIDLKTLVFSLDGVDGSVQGVGHSALRLDDFDGDANVELEVRFQQAAFNRQLRQTIGDTAILRANWLYTDGTEATASAQVVIGP